MEVWFARFCRVMVPFKVVMMFDPKRVNWNMFVATGGLKTTQVFVENHGNTNLNFHLFPELYFTTNSQFRFWKSIEKKYGKRKIWWIKCYSSLIEFPEINPKIIQNLCWRIGTLARRMRWASLMSTEICPGCRLRDCEEPWRGSF